MLVHGWTHLLKNDKAKENEEKIIIFIETECKIACLSQPPYIHCTCDLLNVEWH